MSMKCTSHRCAANESLPVEYPSVVNIQVKIRNTTRHPKAPFTLPLDHNQPPRDFDTLDQFCLFLSLCKWNHTVSLFYYFPLRSAYIWEIQLCCGMWMYFAHFHCFAKFHCISILSFIYTFCYWWLLVISSLGLLRTRLHKYYHFCLWIQTKDYHGWDIGQAFVQKMQAFPSNMLVTVNPGICLFWRVYHGVPVWY